MVYIKLKSADHSSKNVKLKLPAQEAVVGQAISVALGQYGVKLQDFVKDVNKKTSEFPKGLDISMMVCISKDGSYILHIKGPVLRSLISSFFYDNSEKFFTDNDVFLIYTIFKIGRKDVSSIPDWSLCKNIYYILKGLGFIYKR